MEGSDPAGQHLASAVGAARVLAVAAPIRFVDKDQLLSRGRQVNFSRTCWITFH